MVEVGRAFHLEVGGDRLATLTFDLPDRRVNLMGQAVMEELAELVGALAGRSDIGCLVLLSGKADNFIAGADVAQIAGVEDPALGEEAARRGQAIFAAWEALPFPTVAAIRGSCVGGGTELALASTYRVASDRKDLRIGLPEIRLGILPGWGGCTRLPRRIGIAPALDIILAGKTIPGDRAAKVGLVDALLPDASFHHLVREYARARLDQDARSEEGPDIRELLLEKNPVGRKILFDQARKRTLEKTGGRYPAPLRAIEVVRVGIERGREAGFAAEARAIGELVTSPVAKNLIHVYQLSEAAKRPGALPAGEPRPVRSVAVLGAGVMGGGIAQLVAERADLPVRLKDVDAGALAAGMEHAADLFARRVDRRRLERTEARRKMALLRPTLSYTGFSRVDLVIEAVVEKLAVKRKVFAEVAGASPDGAVLASNTSSLSIDAIGAETPNPGRVVGMHFFNPVHRMPLVEVIAGEGTEAAALHTVFDLARRLGKTPVVVKDGPGFLVNRLLMFYSTEALWLLDSGYTIEDVDRAMTDWGMPMGPLALTDEVGVDVATKVAHILSDAFSQRLPLPPWFDRLAEAGRLGKKSGSGFYRYEGRERQEPDPEVYELLELSPRIRVAETGLLVDRMVLPMVNEAARCLEEGIVADPGSLDLALIMGTGFPPFRGGLCRWADSSGLARAVELLEDLAVQIGDRFQPADALRRAAEAGGFYARW